MAERTTETEARTAIRDVLLQWRETGVGHPVIAVYSEERLVPSFFGLDDDLNVVTEDGSVEDSVSAPTGGGIEAVGPDVPLNSALLGAPSQFVFRDGSRLTPAMLRDLKALDGAFAAAFGVHLRVSSGIRLRAEQEAIFRARYVPASEVNGRRVFDFRTWQGIQWARISPEGTVAPPDSRLANHVLENTVSGAADLRDDGRDAGVATKGTRRANWLKANAPAHGYAPDGYSFGEPWHYRYTRDPLAGAGEMQEDTMAYPILLNRVHRFLVSVGSIKHFTDVAASDLTRNIVSAEDTWIQLDTARFLHQLDSFGIPRDRVDIETGHVLDVSVGRLVAGGWWSWAREAQHNTQLIRDKLGI